MGKTVVSWSPVHGQSGTTANTVSLASMFSLDNPTRSLLTHAQLSLSSLEFLFRKGNKEDRFNDEGMEALERLVKSKLLKADAIPDYTKTIYKNRLDLLSGNHKVHEDPSYSETVLRTILSVANDHYDLLWIDAHSGIHNQATRVLLEEADLVLVNLPQNRFVIERFFSGEDFPEALKDKPYVVLISMYDEEAAYSLRTIKRTHKVKVPLFAIPYSSAYRDAFNQQAVTEYFLRSKEVKKGDSSYTFIHSVRQVNAFIKKSAGLSQLEDDGL